MNACAYYKMQPNAIFKKINSSDNNFFCVVEGIKFKVFPHVYPSHQFRTTKFVLKNIKKLIKGKKVCDMGCGPGIVGLYSVINGASSVIQADINKYAYENAKANNLLNNFEKNKIQTYLSNCFDNIPKQIFEVIIFNMPFHNDLIKIKDPLQYAFYDPNFKSIKKFLNQAKNYSNSETKIIIAFSNKGDCFLLEKLFDSFSYKWKLWRKINKDKEYDNRIYILQKK
ncbi:MAG: Ribosomal protein L11 methyltransferase [Candidatus Anoxychlamydiales bacterium]|nr:Ribosomal protein L11 methyltransferase [Candidatus Anoxychlamydiales bacterium]